MSTHAIYGFKRSGEYKITYSALDGEPNVLGHSLLSFIQSTLIKELNDIFNNIIMVDCNEKPTEQQIKECEIYYN